MLNKEITYTDYNGVERTETFSFNLSKAEIVEMETTIDGGFSNMIDRLIKSKNNAELIKIFKQIILKAYGQKSDDGKRFIKSEQLSNDFMQTEAYSMLFMELFSDDGTAAANFIAAIVPNFEGKDKIVENTVKQLENN